MSTEPLKAPFPYFGGKSKAAPAVWAAFGDIKNYVEPFCGSAAMLLSAPDCKRTETINDADGFVSNFWRAVAREPETVARHADWPVNEADLFARHSWLVRHAKELLYKLHGDHDYYDAKLAGWWCWGSCAWIGCGWCSGEGPWVHDGHTLVLGNAGQGINRKPEDGTTRGEFIRGWMLALHNRLRDVRVACGDWQRVCGPSVTTKHGLTGVFLDPPYTKGAMDYAAGGVGTDLPMQVQAWCAANGGNKLMRVVLCGHAGEHDALLSHGWTTEAWTAGSGYACGANKNYKTEALWLSPHCLRKNNELF